MWDSRWLAAVMEIRQWVCQRKIKGKTVRERDCFFLKFGQTKDKRIEKGKAKVNHADRQGVLYEVSNL